MSEVKDLKTEDIFIFDKETGTIRGYNKNHPNYTEPGIVNKEFYDDDEKYPIENYTIIPEQVLIIPEEIDGVPVRIISTEAFSVRNFSKVVFSNNLKEIGRGAFEFSRIASMGALNNIEIICDNAFYYSDFMFDTLTIPESVTKIGERAFNYTIIDKLIIEAPVTLIAENTFGYCNITKLILPDTIQSIEYGAFCDNNLTEIKLPRDLIRIGDYAFAGNPLREIEFNDKVVCMGEGSFDVRHISNIILTKRSFANFIKCFSSIEFMDMCPFDITCDGKSIDIDNYKQIETVIEFIDARLICVNTGIDDIMNGARDALYKLQELLQENKLEYERLKRRMDEEDNKIPTQE